jgi:Suppressor of fused protein (SUFU)
VDDERSPGGIPIHRHDEVVDGELAAPDPDLIAAVDAHVTRHIGPPATVYHELVSPHVHVDVHVVAPTDDRPVYTLVTSGMSERPMVDGSFAELTITLPPTWPAPGSPEMAETSASWPYTLLQELAWLPHAFQTVLWKGHTVPNGDPPEPYAPGTRLCGALVGPQLTAPDEFKVLRYGEREIHILAVYPLHADEMQVKLDRGTDALYDLLDAAKLTEILDVDRPSVAPAKRRGWFRR